MTVTELFDAGGLDLISRILDRAGRSAA